MHVHSEHSPDGVHTIEHIIDVARENGIEWLSITDHNNLEGVRKLWQSKDKPYTDAFIDCDGVKVVSGVEVTCRLNSVLNNKGRSCKLHLLVYGASLDPSSPLSRLITAKHKNDYEYDFGVLEYILSQDSKHNVTMQDVRDFIQKKKQTNPGYSTLSRDDMHEFLLEYGVNVAKSNRAFMSLLKEAPHVERLDIDAEELINIAHASGGMVVLAHPALSLKRTQKSKEVIRELLKLGLDGVEWWYNCDNKLYTEYKDIMSPLLSQDTLYLGGSDCHNFAHGINMGRYSGNPLHTHMIKRFLVDMMVEQSHRETTGKVFMRKFFEELKDIDKLVKRYEDEQVQLSIDAEKRTQGGELSKKALNHAINRMKKKKAKKAKKERKKQKGKRPTYHDDKIDEDWENYMASKYSGSIGDLLCGSNGRKGQYDIDDDWYNDGSEMYDDSDD